MDSIRLKLAKQGRAKYISHLDLSRCMQRAIKRAGIPIWYTEGFNPRAYINFLLPLSLGFESVCEYAEIKLTQELTPKELIARLSAALPQGLTVLSAAPPKHKHTEIASAEYEITAKCPAAARFEDFLALEKIEVEKTTKKRGTMVIDIKPSLEVLTLHIAGDEIRLQVRLPAGVSETVNPALLFDAFTHYSQAPIDSLHILRTQIYTDFSEVFA